MEHFLLKASQALHGIAPDVLDKMTQEEEKLLRTWSHSKTISLLTVKRN